MLADVEFPRVRQVTYSEIAPGVTTARCFFIQRAKEAPMRKQPLCCSLQRSSPVVFPVPDTSGVAAT